MKPKEKEKLIFEVYLLGSFIDNKKKEEFKEYYSNFCEGKEQYSITTYINKIIEGIGNISNLIEVHKTDKNILSKGFIINDEETYTKYNAYEHYPLFLVYSNTFIKYIAQNRLQSKLGNKSVVEFSRCEDNIHDMLSTIGYIEKSKIVKSMYLYKYKKMQNIYFQASTIIEEKNTNLRIELFELFGFCDMADEDILIANLSKVKEELSRFIDFSE